MDRAGECRVQWNVSRSISSGGRADSAPFSISLRPPVRNAREQDRRGGKIGSVSATVKYV